ncbi:MAG: hypothetical protein A2Y76_05735 [Planctomycetes bacterium RBG_13_60_9]|nr:MAG: hypothetical protein A2Y76_05735 [Planctomycetes bacterium RBG_13_60_9]
MSILFQVEGDPDRALAFAGLDSFRVSKVSATVADVTYGATPAPGSWVFGLRREKFLACKEVDLVLCGFNAQLTVDSRITI